MFKSFLASGILALSMIGSAGAAEGIVVQDRNLVIEPGSDPSSVMLHFGGAQRVLPWNAGSLQIVNADGATWHYRPVAYQIVNGKRHYVATAFHIVDRDHATLQLQKYDATLPLVIGPVNGKS